MRATEVEATMPRHRKRKTDRKRQDERVLRIRGVRRRTPDPKKLSRAFIGLALARAEVEAQAQAEAERRASTDEERNRAGGDAQNDNS